MSLFDLLDLFAAQVDGLGGVCPQSPRFCDNVPDVVSLALLDHVVLCGSFSDDVQPAQDPLAVLSWFTADMASATGTGIDVPPRPDAGAAGPASFAPYDGSDGAQLDGAPFEQDVQWFEQAPDNVFGVCIAMEEGPAGGQSRPSPPILSEGARRRNTKAYWKRVRTTELERPKRVLDLCGDTDVWTFVRL